MRVDRIQSELKPAISLADTERVALCEVLDRVLNKGAVLVGNLTISVADVDLIYLGLQLVLTSMENVQKNLEFGRDGAGAGFAIGKGKPGGVADINPRGV